MKIITRLWPPGIRLQLTFWYIAVFVTLLLFTGAYFYKYLEQSLEGSVDTALQVRAQQMAGGIEFQDGKIVVLDVLGELPGFDPDAVSPVLSQSDANYDALVRLLDEHGKLVHETPAFHTLVVPVASVTQPLQGNPWQGSVTGPNGQEVRLYSRALTEEGKTYAVIQVAQSLADLHATLQHLVEKLLLVGFLVLLASAAGSYLLAARAFKPIRHLTETARRIKEGNLHQRVPVPRARDEVQFLATTLNEMINSLDQAFIRQRRFVADASHELRTPVAVIRSKSDLALLQESTQQDYITVLHAINTETERMGHLISDLLALARGDEGQTAFDQEPVRLDQLVQAVVGNAEALAAEQGITLELQLQGAVTTIGDESRLIQVIMNLLDNAIFYTHAGGVVTLVVEATQTEARVAVRDTGIGIPADKLPHIFERFYRVDPARTGGRSGLGLAIVEWVVKAHAGSVTVESQVGQGSCFTVILPLARSAALLALSRS